MSEELKMADKHYVLNEVCDEMYREKWGNVSWVFDDMICAADLKRSKTLATVTAVVLCLRNYQ
eukprot:scaffold11048_cov98-Skeletonema_menzelii.AAC.4